MLCEIWTPRGALFPATVVKSVRTYSEKRRVWGLAEVGRFVKAHSLGAVLSFRSGIRPSDRQWPQRVATPIGVRTQGRFAHARRSVVGRQMLRLVSDRAKEIVDAPDALSPQLRPLAQVQPDESRSSRHLNWPGSHRDNVALLPN